jgi:phosphoribosylaminoimidazole-succinocarboxamide synthase
MKILYEGKAKQILEGPVPEQVIVHFKDSATAFDGEKAAEIGGKGRLNALMSAHLFELLADRGVKTHYVEKTENGFLARRVTIVPLEVVIRNVAAGSIVRRLGVENGLRFKEPLVEFYYKSDELHDPLLCLSHIELLGFASTEDVGTMTAMALDTNRILGEYFDHLDLLLVDMKFEFGRAKDGEILLADEISPDTMRLWAKDTETSMDKDVFRFDKGDLIETYTRVARKMGVI